MSAVFSQTTRALALDSPARSVTAAAIAALLLGAWCAWALLGHVTVFQLSQQARLEVQRAAQPLAAAAPGRLVALRLAPGQVVQAGEVLAELDAETQTLQLAEQRAHHEALAAQLLALQAEQRARSSAAARDAEAAVAAGQAAALRAEEAAAALVHAEQQARRLADEAAAGATSLADAQQARAEARRLAAARDAQQADARRLAAEAATRAAAERALADTLRRQQAALDGERAASEQTLRRLEHELAWRQLRAPVAGRIGDLAPLQPGDTVAAGQRLASIVPDGELRVVADFDAGSAGRIHAGQHARLRLAGFAWAQYGTLPARVERVAAELRDGRLRVELAPQGAPPPGLPLQHGLPGSVEVEVEQLSPAQLLLRAAGARLAGGAAS